MVVNLVITTRYVNTVYLNTTTLMKENACNVTRSSITAKNVQKNSDALNAKVTTNSPKMVAASSAQHLMQHAEHAKQETSVLVVFQVHIF